MNKTYKFIVVLIIAFAVFGIRKYIIKNNPTFGMTTQEKIYHYFNIKISDDNCVEKEYISPGLVAYKIDISSFNNVDVDSFTKGYQEYTVKSYDLYKCNLNVDWWDISKNAVNKAFVKFDSPKRDIGAKTAEFKLFFVKENDKTFLYMIYLD